MGCCCLRGTMQWSASPAPMQSLCAACRPAGHAWMCFQCAWCLHPGWIHAVGITHHASQPELANGSAQTLQLQLIHEWGRAWVQGGL